MELGIFWVEWLKKRIYYFITAPYMALGQLVHRRDNIMKQRTRLVNQLHEQLCIAYPSYKQFLNDISRPTALYFWEHYPSRKYLKGKTVVDLREELVPVSHNKCSTKTCEKILDAVASDKVKKNDFQDARDMVTLSIVSDLQHYDKQLAEVDKMYHPAVKVRIWLPSKVTDAYKQQFISLQFRWCRYPQKVHHEIQ